MIEEAESSVELVETELSREEQQLVIRKESELKIILNYDRTSMNIGRECWYLMDTDWLNNWMKWVKGDNTEAEPGPVSSKELLDSNGIPIPNLKNKIDYRGVSPLVYFIFVALHGKDPHSPDIPRYVLDIYKPAVPIERVVAISSRAIPKAKLKVNKIRQKYMTWEVDYGDEQEEEPVSCCCGLSREHLEAFIYWAVHCWSYCRSKRKPAAGATARPAYSAYKPLRNDLAAMEEGDSSHGSAAGGEGSSSESADPENTPQPKKVSMFTRVKNSLTERYEARQKAKAAAKESQFKKKMDANSRIERSTPMASRSQNDVWDEDSVDESDNDYENVTVGTADKHHEQGQWMNGGIQTIQNMNR